MKKQWMFKACPRCNGDLIIDRDEDGSYYKSCFQCGYIGYLDSKNLAEKTTPDGKTEVVDIFEEYLKHHPERYRCECGRIYTPNINDFKCPKCGADTKKIIGNDNFKKGLL